MIPSAPHEDESFSNSRHATQKGVTYNGIAYLSSLTFLVLLLFSPHSPSFCFYLFLPFVSFSFILFSFIIFFFVSIFFYFLLFSFIFFYFLLFYIIRFLILSLTATCK